MFGANKKIENLNERLILLTELVVSQHKEIRKLIIKNQTETLNNRVLIEKQKSPVRVIEKEVVVNRARKKPRERLRTSGGKRITQEEIAEFIRLFDQGLSFVEISGMTGRSTSSISTKIFEAQGHANA